MRASRSFALRVAGTWLVCALATALPVNGDVPPAGPSAPAPGRGPARPGEPLASEESVAQASDARFDGPDERAARESDLAEMTAAAARWPNSYDLLWRAARAAWAIGDRLDEDTDSERLGELGRQARAWVEEAVRLRPEGIEGRFYRALAISTYARGRGIFRSLLEGLGGRYESDMGFVIEKDPAWGFGAGYRALGRYWFVVPRPKRNLARSEAQLRQALQYAPDWMRTHLYLGDTLAAQGRPEEAGREYRFILQHEAPPAEANEAEFIRNDARRALAGLRKP